MNLPELFNEMRNLQAELDITEDLSYASNLSIQQQIEFPQPKSARHVDENGAARVGMIYVGPSDNVSEGKYVRQLRFMLVDSILVNLLTKDNRVETYGGRRMRAYTISDRQVMERDMSQPDNCASANGIVPHEKFIGSIVVDPRTMKEHKIGFKQDENNNWVPITDFVEVHGQRVPDVCRQCPLADWSLGKPPCEQAWRFVVYVFGENGESGFLATVRGENSGVQNALRGVFKKGSQAGRFDGAPLIGIRATSTPDKRKVLTKAIPFAQFHPVQNKYVVGIAKDENLTGYVNTNDIANVDQNEYPFIVLNVPTSQTFPQGRPEVVGENVPVYPTIMKVTRNGYQINGRPNPTFVPDFEISQTPLTEAEYAEYAAAYVDYFANKTNVVFLRLRESVVNRLYEQFLLEAPEAFSAALLPSKTDDTNIDM